MRLRWLSPVMAPSLPLALPAMSPVPVSPVRSGLVPRHRRCCPLGLRFSWTLGRLRPLLPPLSEGGPMRNPVQLPVSPLVHRPVLTPTSL